jgi:hypothetical protein
VGFLVSTFFFGCRMDYLDEFAALDAALEQISEQYEAPAVPPPDDAFDDMMYDAAPPPPPVPEFNDEPWDEKPDVSSYVNASSRNASVARGEQVCVFKVHFFFCCDILHLVCDGSLSGY